MMCIDVAGTTAGKEAANSADSTCDGKGEYEDIYLVTIKKK